jgi:hypothetical protein
MRKSGKSKKSPTPATTGKPYNIESGGMGFMTRIKLGTRPPTSTTPRRPLNGSTKIICENRHLQTKNQTMEFGILRDNVSDKMTTVQNRLSTPPAPFPSIMHNDLHWTFCHEEQCSTHEKEKIYYPPRENGYPHDYYYCGKEHYLDLDEIIRTQ